MARVFVSANSENLLTSSSPISSLAAGEVTLAGWGKVDSEPTDNQQVFGIGDSGYFGDYISIIFNWGGGDQLRGFMSNIGGSNINAYGSTDMTTVLGSWFHFQCEFKDTGTNYQARILLNGSVEGSDAQTKAASYNWNRISIGSSADSTIAGYTDAEFADLAIWQGRRIEDAETAALANGASPLTVAPSYLKFYSRLIRPSGDDYDIISNLTLTDGNTVGAGEGPGVLSIGPHYPTSGFVPRYATLAMTGGEVAENALTSKDCTITLHNARWVA